MGYELQRYRCKDCGKWFVVNYGFEKMRYDPNAITACIDLYFKGVSFRNIADHLKQFFGRKPSCSTIHDWLKRYTRLAKEYVDQIAPQTSGFLHVDEMKVNINGNLDWLWNLMDSDTRFWISSMISQRRETEDAQRVFQDAKQKLSVMPMAVAHDGLQSYGEAFKREFYTNTLPRTIDVRSVSIRDRGLNNRVERLNQTFRDRNKTQRGLDSGSSAQEMSDGIRIAYNFTRPHSALKGKTPAEAAGLDLRLGQNRWKSLIEQSAKAAEAERKAKPAD
jgi:transposase-like protein